MLQASICGELTGDRHMQNKVKKINKGQPI